MRLKWNSLRQNGQFTPHHHHWPPSHHPGFLLVEGKLWRPGFSVCLHGGNTLQLLLTVQRNGAKLENAVFMSCDGAHAVSLGAWNCSVILKDCSPLPCLYSSVLTLSVLLLWNGMKPITWRTPMVSRGLSSPGSWPLFHRRIPATSWIVASTFFLWLLAKSTQVCMPLGYCSWFAPNRKWHHRCISHDQVSHILGWIIKS